MRERLGAYAAGGITTLCLMPLCAPDGRCRRFVDALAPA